MARLRAAFIDRRPVAVAAYTSRPRTTEAASAARRMLCEQGDADCNRLCTARHSDLTSCDGAAGFDDRELFELLLEPGHRSPLYRSSHLAARFALGLATGQEWSTSTISTAGRRSPASRSPTGWPTTPSCSPSATPCWSNSANWAWAYPVAISEAHEQAIISGHDRAEFRRMTLSSWNSTAGLLRSPPGPHPNASPGSEHIFPSGRSPARWSGFSPGDQSDRRP